MDPTLMKDEDFRFIKETGEARDLRTVPPKELQALVKSLYKDFQYHKELFAAGFHPPGQRLEETYNELDRCYSNVLAYVHYLTLKKEDIPQLINTAGEKYDGWLDKAKEALHTSRKQGSSVMLTGPNEARLHAELGIGAQRITRGRTPASPGSESRGPGSDPPPTDATSGNSNPLEGLRPLGGSTPPPPAGQIGGGGGAAPPPGGLVGPPSLGQTQPRTYLDAYGRVHRYPPIAQPPQDLASALQAGLRANPWGFTRREESFWGIETDRARLPSTLSDPVLGNGTVPPIQGQEGFGSSWQWPPQAPPSGGRRFQDMTNEEFVSLVTTIAQRSSGSDQYGYDYAPRRRYHLLELPKFSGKVEEYPLFRQNLGVCLERERFRDEKDKALFIYNHLEGQARELVTHFMVPLSQESCAAVLSRLERTYGREQDVDRLLIRKLYKLPKLVDLTYDGLVHMITVIEAAMPAMARREPEELRTADGDRLSRLLSLIPPNDADMFYMHCFSNNLDADLRSFVRYLTFRCQARKVRLPLPTDKSAPVKPSKPIRRVYYQGASPDDVSDQEDEEGNPVFLAGERQRPPCSLCESAHHDFGYCPKFKALDIHAKREAVNKVKACSSCLRSGHFIRDCRSKRKCTHEGCNRNHHPLLHDDYVMRVNYFDEVGGEFPEPVHSETTDSQ
jgi:hypothetical protein